MEEDDVYLKYEGIFAPTGQHVETGPLPIMMAESEGDLRAIGSFLERADNNSECF